MTEALSKKIKYFEISSGLLIFLFPAMLMTIPDAGSTVLLLLLIISIIGLFNNKLKLPVTNAEWVLIASIGFYILIFAFNIWYFEGEISELDNATRFLLLLPVFFFIRKSNLSEGYVFYGILVGTAGCFAIAAYQVFFQGELRANGITNWVTFGGVSITLGLMCFAMGLISDNWKFKVIMFMGFLLGTGASILSGSRGSWIALLAGLFFLFIINPRRWSIKTRVITIIVSLLIITSTYLIPTVQSRIDTAVANIDVYLSNDNAFTSVGLRLETWRVSAIAIEENWLLGIGEGNFRSKMEQMVDQGLANPVIATSIAHAHNEFISATLHRGVPGLFSLLLLFLIPLMMFLKNIRHEEGNRKLLLSCGIMLIISSMATSLSDNFFEHHNETLFYTIYIYIIYAVMRSQGQNSKTETEDDPRNPYHASTVS